MTNTLSLLPRCAGVLLAAAMISSPARAADVLQHPRIAIAGGVADIGEHPDAQDPRARKLLFDLTDPATNAAGLNRGLDTVARALNLFALTGVPNDRVQTVVLLHGGAASLALRPEAFEARENAPHANAALIDALMEAGVRFEICGQSVNARGFARDELDPRVTVFLSAMTRRETLLHEGYLLIR
ncbi:hypothetical protein CSC70_06225 [Pseudoxanthomonas kalamensis DSM 18571]|uniref:DsrE family protein n=1 Tax=Pseudoxanthomonas kalamensis TaxID=289483 RepID=UPI001391F866|nr:DsrE family protein [Pseudoxanthomonas kalamensis]KAF1711492.1 hypothetical protein CSC70_06225 [Pseudoxanthomonas kalamensis DSM 18571]